MNLLTSFVTFYAVSVPKVAPNMDNMPGSQTAQTIVGWVMALGLFICFAGGAWGAAQFGGSQFVGNSHARESGLRKVGAAMGGALLIVAIPTLLKIFADLGSTFR